MKKEAIATRGAPDAIGPYSQAIASHGMIFLSGQIPIDPATGDIVAGGIAAQAERVLENLRAVLEASGCGFADVVKTTIYVTDLAHFATVNGVYAKALAPPFPARATVQVAALPRGALVEIDAIAVRPAPPR